MVKNYGMFSQAQQEICHRLHDAVMRVFKLRKKGITCGFPRFRPLERMRSIHYPQFGFSLGRKLKVAPFGELAIKKHREIKGKVKTLTLKREASGKWFAIFCAAEERVAQKANEGKAVGIDLGLASFATLSSGETISNPRHLKKHEEKLAFLQRKLSRKKKRSKNRLGAKLRVARTHEKVRNSRQDFLHKLSSQLVSSHSLIALEKLASKKMAEQHLGKHINDAAWDKFANMMAYKAESAGCQVVFVDAKNTSKECSSCGALREMPLHERLYACPSCDMRVDRDINAALNILKRATGGTPGSNASGDEPKGLSLKEDTTRFRGGSSHAAPESIAR